jgi:drug/metabolite transporter (DMT)-like permease
MVGSALAQISEKNNQYCTRAIPNRLARVLLWVDTSTVGNCMNANPDLGKQQTMDARPSSHAYAVLLGSQIAIGGAAIFARFALHGTGPVGVAALRLTIAALPLLAFSWPQSKLHSVPRKHELLFACSGVALAIHFATWIGSLLYTPVAVSTLLVCTSPVWTALYDSLILKQRMSKIFWFALLSAGCGVTLIVRSGSGSAPIAGRELFGDLLAVIGSVGLAGYLIAIRSVSNFYPTIVIVGRTYSWTALVLSIAAISLRQFPPGRDMMSWGGILAMVLISQILGHTGMTASLRCFPASTVAFSTLLEPVFAALLAALFFAEDLSVRTLSGFVLVLLSIAVILRVQAADTNTQRQIALDANEL